jgi:hypothetical protein
MFLDLDRRASGRMLAVDNIDRGDFYIDRPAQEMLAGSEFALISVSILTVKQTDNEVP